MPGTPTLGTELESSALSADSFHLFEFRKTLVSLLLFLNFSEKGEIPLEIKHVPGGVESSQAICSLGVSCIRADFRKPVIG